MTLEKQTKNLIASGLMITGTMGMLGVTLGAARFAAADEKTAPAADPTPQQIEFFENKIRPLLHDNCFGCHGEKQQLGGIRLDSMAQIMKGNSAGPSVVAGSAEKSPLIQVVHYDGKVKMPPAGKLKPEQIADLTAWVNMGAPWPGVKAADLLKMKPTGGVTPEQRNHWSFRPVKKPAPPKVKNTAWVKSPIDAFILEKLEKKQISPALTADRRTLLRRVTFGLTGLPPTPEEVDAFLKDTAPNAFAKVVDRLLASPHYGERWGRYWLDVARYADTKGYVFTSDPIYHNAYTYRDWVINAFNADLPYDQFIIQQLAADKMPLGDDHRPLAAMGFLTLGRRFLFDPVLIADDRMDVTVRGLMGLSIGCARCHDHKFDPIPAKDYYSLYGVFASSTDQEPPPPISDKPIREPYEAYIKQVLETEKQRDNIIVGQVNRLRQIMEKTPAELSDPIKKTLQGFRVGEMPNEGQMKALLPQFMPEAQTNLTQANARIAELKKTPPATPEFANALKDGGLVEPRVFIRGNPNNQGDAVPRRFLAVLSPEDRKPFTQGSGRLELAQLIASKQNPLTARVFVNRVWMYHFGAPLVRTPGDFGVRGDKPTHPELLDWLAARFMEENWSIKKLHRMILLSGAYQMRSNTDNPRAMEIDSDNRLFWHQNRQRLDLESLRDSLLAVSGQMDQTIGGKSVELTRAPYPKRRSIYGYIDRNNLQGFYRTFDFASPDMSTPQRARTTVPQQALFMMNSPFVVEQARALTDKIMKAEGKREEKAGVQRPEAKGNAAVENPVSETKTGLRSVGFQKAVSRKAKPQKAGGNPKSKIQNPKSDTPDGQRIVALYRQLFGRAPSADELSLGLEYVKQPASNAPRTGSAWQYGYGAYDEGTQRVVNFKPLPHFTGTGYQGGTAMPDPTLQYLLLTATGGHVGADKQHAVIRRWVSPVDGVLAIHGSLEHGENKGDGVQARVISSRLGSLGYWSAFHSKTDTNIDKVEVRKGDVLDFVVDCKASQDFDSFLWSPVLKAQSGKGAKLAVQQESLSWSASDDFRGPETPQASRPNLAWEKYVHTLLMTNEFCFVD